MEERFAAIDCTALAILVQTSTDKDAQTLWKVVVFNFQQFLHSEIKQAEQNMKERHIDELNKKVEENKDWPHTFWLLLARRTISSL